MHIGIPFFGHKIKNFGKNYIAMLPFTVYKMVSIEFHTFLHDAFMYYKTKQSKIVLRTNIFIHFI